MSEEERAKRPYLGLYFMTSGSFFVILYLLCLASMLNRERIHIPAFKIMICLAIFDIPSECINSVATGYMGFYGIYYCDYPRLTFILGAIVFGAWVGCSASSITLALCRISEINQKLNLHWIFHSSFIYLLLFFSFVVASYGMFFTKPPIFRPEYMTWFFDAGIGFDPSYYYNVSQVINNISLTVITLSLYTYLVSSLIRKGNNIESAQFTKTQRQVILQAAIICFFHSIGSLVCVYMQLFYSPKWLIVAAHVCWQCCTGCASVIYLTLNQTIRSSVRKMICPARFQNDNRVSNASDGMLRTNASEVIS
ncbi:hypothetical protein GCK72_020067 [Caenorhabditis remanei]|uniref:Serpentine Receptor, class T n=2 Tax=Caenorhabditis remanei TaxID=31234 RepID=A0A6A5GEI2_CAERE|nr:hypothetical protein GCK72_020067 [Caenorhabditis remanei]KAF1753510.1 hypothetical protein GCK72_020067 [Caenorhabditis remanei]